MASQDVATKADIEQVIRSNKADIESVVLLIEQLIHHLEEKIEQRFDAQDRRFEILENRVSRMADSMVYYQNQAGAISRWSEGIDRSQLSVLGTQAAQQKAIDNLNERVTRLEQKDAQSNQN